MKQLLFTLLSFFIALPTFAQTPLAIVTGFNEGGPDGVAIALAEDLPAGTRIYLTTEEYQVGDSLFADNTTGTVDEFVGYWESPTEVPEGMVLAFSEVTPNYLSVECNNTGWFTFQVDCGSFTTVSGDFDINQEQEIYLYSDNDNNPGNGITQMHSAIYINFAGNKAFPAANNPGTPTGDYPYTFDVDSLPSVANPAKRFLNINGSGRFTNHIRGFLQRPSRWNQNDSFLGFTKLDSARFLEINLNYCVFSTDTDGDLICDFDPHNVGIYTPDNCINTPNADQADADNDGIGDVCDIMDSDNDGVDDPLDNCPFTANPGQEDNDGDNIGDVCDTDDDNDGVLDINDNCPLSANLDQEDNDSDNMGDICDDDDDNDGILDVNDNCSLTANADQNDNDGDTIGDACDDDDDNDGVLDVNDNCPLTANPGQEDIDLDGIGDECDPSLDAATVIQNAIATIQGTSVNKGQKKSLGNRLINANKDYCKDNDIVEATAKLNQFINKVQTHASNGEINAADEQLLVASAQAMIDAMNDGTYDCSGSSPRISFSHTNLTMNAYPNPTQGRLNVEFNLQEDGSAIISIIDLTGRVVYKKEVSSQNNLLKIELDDRLTEGQYFIRLTAASGTVAKKIVLTR